MISRCLWSLVLVVEVMAMYSKTADGTPHIVECEGFAVLKEQVFRPQIKEHICVRCHNRRCNTEGP
uniref:ZP domain-containing protein n=1 Tax=Anguilla anguilla TaxID=7936 RepID=A0A0E9X4K3_ANGAN